MRKLFIISALMIAAAPLMTSAQEDLKRPKKSGLEEYDQFMNNSFDIYEASTELKKKLDGEMELADDDLEKLNKLRVDLKQLQETSQSMLQNAKKVKNPMKAGKAVKNTNQSIKALKVSKTNFEYIMGKIGGDEGDE